MARYQSAAGPSPVSLRDLWILAFKTACAASPGSCINLDGTGHEAQRTQIADSNGDEVEPVEWLAWTSQHWRMPSRHQAEDWLKRDCERRNRIDCDG